MSANSFTLAAPCALGIACALLTACDRTSASQSATLARLEQTEARIAAVEQKVDAFGSALDGPVAWAKTAAAAREAEATAAPAPDSAKERRRARRLARARDAASSSSPSPRDPADEAMAQGPGVQCDNVTEHKRRCLVDSALVETLWTTPASLAKQFRVIPYRRDGRVYGYRLSAIRRGTIGSRLGIKNGDILVAIDDESLTTPDEMLALYTELRDATHFDLEFERRGKPFDLEIEILEP
ncbi:MAG: hypothetical protein AAF721_04375 [Myxococcota bacterium]